MASTGPFHRPPGVMTAAGASVGIVPLLQICYLSLSKGNLPSSDVLSLLLSKVITATTPPPPPSQPLPLAMLTPFL